MPVSLRTKLILSFVLVVLICGFVATWVGVRLIGDEIVRQAQDKVRIDLNSARVIYQHKVEKIQDTVLLTSVRFFMRESLLKGDLKLLREELRRIRARESLDILTLTDRNGTVIYRTRNPDVHRDSEADDTLVKQVLDEAEVVAATEIIPREELVKEGVDLADRARIESIPTPKAKPREETEEVRGMMIKAAAPVLDRNNNLLGVLYGGTLLNRSYEIVDKIKDTIYQGEIYKGKDVGTATIFQGDLRISTNVIRKDGSRAIGTRVSEEVYDQVLGKGLPWVERAFVVDDWYITAYEPIRNIAGEIIGILYVGMLEEKFADKKRATMWVFLGIAVAGVVGALAVSYILAKGILNPIKHLVFASQQLAQGDLSHTVTMKSRDEIGRLGDTFNFMAASLRDRDEQLKQRTQATIMESEQLATIGQLAAGVAHEMNNPLGGILLYGNLLLEKAKDGDPAKEDLQRIIDETERCRKIVKGLLDFSRQTKLEMRVADLNKILENTLDLIVTQGIFRNIEVIRNFNPSIPNVMVDVGQMQSVFINIALNAAESMNGAGTLTVSTEEVGENGPVQVCIADTGAGISKENLSRIFDPFFTTKPIGKGTGLGLSIAFGIVRKHNGTIEVESDVGKGSVFKINLPAVARRGV